MWSKIQEEGEQERKEQNGKAWTQRRNRVPDGMRMTAAVTLNGNMVETVIPQEEAGVATAVVSASYKVG